MYWLTLLFVILMLTGIQYSVNAQDSNSSTVKNGALAVLQTKCNTCHAVHNRKKVFTEANIETHAANIYKQVFVKRRMPKGSKVTLTKDEEAALLLWLKQQGVVARNTR